MFPDWFHLLAIGTLCLGALSALIIAVDVKRHPQHMMIMNIVWPVTALFGSVPLLWFYFRYGRLATHEVAHAAMKRGEEMPSKVETPFPVIVGKGALHCGSGCMIGDVIAEWLAFAVPATALLFGWKTVFEDKIFAAWGLDFVFAFALGIVFQYLAIVPMRNLSMKEGLIAALKADTLSLVSWQVGMYGMMALLQFLVFPAAFATRADVNTPEFWFAMQLAMLAGLLTSYPVNWYLITVGIKERM
ncbi:DUF4396 domain-containing protein [Roseibium aggregatum]|uniref:DUF4396 domain-containing protein n=1 Tax=Roseibium aggregatum TaxID=187304 RepID=A0A926P6G2_9HYPH|nr:DUF4396 domain-containing protein [Roseibium aggregatum]MBD1548762.1 DUF4396 domain-containing protein [Roseibium aggregatum]